MHFQASFVRRVLEWFGRCSEQLVRERGSVHSLKRALYQYIINHHSVTVTLNIMGHFKLPAIIVQFFKLWHESISRDAVRLCHQKFAKLIIGNTSCTFACLVFYVVQVLSRGCSFWYLCSTVCSPLLIVIDNIIIAYCKGLIRPFKKNGFELL